MSHFLVYFDTTSASPAPEYEGLVLYRISWLWYSAVCFGVTYVVGLIVSVLWRGKYHWREASSETLIASRASRFLSRLTRFWLHAGCHWILFQVRKKEGWEISRCPIIRHCIKDIKKWKYEKNYQGKQDQKHWQKIPQGGKSKQYTLHFDSEDDYRTGCRNVCHCQQQQSYSGLCSSRRSYSTYFWNDSWVPTFHSCFSKLVLTVHRWSPMWWGWFATAIQNKILLTGLCIEETAKNTGRPTTSGWRRGKLLLLRKIIFQSVKQAARRKKSKYFQ